MRTGSWDRRMAQGANAPFALKCDFRNNAHVSTNKMYMPVPFISVLFFFLLKTVFPRFRPPRDSLRSAAVAPWGARARARCIFSSARLAALVCYCCFSKTLFPRRAPQ